ncbi:MAG: hypothetical protein K0R18_401 [Bacillales bacterium]|jgi:hypothetical protein|nr:hypothetical protein [Bacillales bacterium]
MSQLTDEQLKEVVDAIYNAIPDRHHSLAYFGAAIEDNGLEHLFTEEEMDAFHDCQLTYQAEEKEENDEDDDCEDGDDCDCEVEEEEEEDVTYEVQRSYPWSSGSWLEGEDTLEDNLREEVERVVKIVIADEEEEDDDDDDCDDGCRCDSCLGEES